MKIPNVKRCVSGLMAAMMVLTSCGTSTPVFADEIEYPPLQSVIDQLDADEIVRPSDYIVPVGAEFNVSIDFSNLDIPDPSKVNIYLDDAVNAEGSWFSTDHADTYRTTYHIEPVSGHPVYQISRSIRVKESEKPAPAETESVQTGSNGISEEGSPSEEQPGEDSTEEDSQTDETGPGDTEFPPTDSGSDSGTESVITELQEASDGQEQPEDTDDPDHDDSSVADESVVPSDTDSSLSLDEEPVQETESGIGSTLTEEVPSVKEDDKPSILSVIVGGIAGLFAKDEIEVPEDELIDEALVGASGAAIDASVNCTSTSFGSVFVNHAYQTSGNSGGDVIIYCGEVDMHFSEGVHTRQNLVGTSLEGHTVTSADALRVGIMQYYFWNKAGVGNDKARGLTQRAVWAMAVGDEAGGVSNSVWLTQAGLLDVYNAGKSYASANASKFELGECYALVQGDSQKLVYLSVSEKPDEGSAKLVKKSSDAAVSGNSSYSLKGAVYGVYTDKDCTKKVKELTTGDNGTSNTVTLSAGTYYVKEITAPKNFKKDGTVHTVKVESGKTATVNVTDTPEKTPFHVLKTSEDGGGMPVTGTVYTVYSDQGCTKSVGTLTVGKDGKSNVLEVLYGTYYVKETKAAEGYALDTEVHTVECKSTSEAEIKLSDKVVRAGIRMTKWDAEMGRSTAQGSGTLKGAEIEVISENEYDIVVGGKPVSRGGTAVKLVSDAEGVMQTSADLLPIGSYSWKEVKAPAGYSLGGAEGSVTEGTFAITAEDAGTVKDLTGKGPSDAVLRAGVRFDKQDLELKEKASQGDAVLEGAVIDIVSENDNPVSVGGKEYKKGDVVLTLTTGNDGTAASGKDALPAGSYSWKETKAPAGYMLEGTVSGSFVLTEKDAGTIKDLSGKGPSDQVIRGGVKIGKWEAETERRDPQGGSSLGGTTFAIVNKSEGPVLVGGKLYETGATIATVKTDKEGYWESKNDWLPYGSYAAIETEAPEGHENAGTVRNFEIRKDGEVIDLDKGQFRDQVFRGDLELVKAGQNKKERLANVAFLITSKTTGEAHVLVTDPNGQAGTASSYAAHTKDTNKNDDAYKDGEVDDAELSYTYGIWFSGETDATVQPDDAKGALPYDTYTVQELRCAANEGYELVSYDITVYRNGAVVDCGTVDDDEIPKVEMATQASNDKAKTPEGHHIALAEEKTELTDKVSYDGLTSGKTYTLKTVLMDRTTGTVVQDKNGKDISLETKFKVHFWNRSGTVEVPVVIDARGLEGHTVVFFEYLYDEDGKEVGRHTDIDDEDQTIVFPKAETEASDEVTKTNIILPAEDIRVKDILKYENLLVGKEYLVTGTLMDKKTGEAVLDDNGQPVTTSKRFTAEKKDGEVEMLFEFSGVKLAGTVMVAFEKVSISGVEIMAHADLSDEDQTIYEPSIRTSASDKETGEKEFEADGVRTICDHVAYEALPKGRYVLVGTLMNKETGGAFVNAEGKELTAEKEFEVTEMSGTVDVEFTVDAAAFAGKSVVVFEKAFSVKEDGTREETPAAVHEDISDEEQTVSFPKIGTVLLDKDTESHCAKASEKATHIDTVTYSGLIVGKEYTAKGRLVDKETGEPVLDGGKEVTAEKTFTAETASGKVEIVFTFNASALEGKAVVAFEDLYREKKLIATHADLSDEDQTIHYPKIGTELRDSGSGTHYTTAVDDAVLIDTVSYSNLIAGRKYNVVGVLMDKETGAQVQADGEAVRATTEFTSDGPDGTVELSFRISGPALAGKTVVAFEVLYDDGKEVAAHEDMDDEAQTVYSPGIRTEFINNESNSHYAEAENTRNFTDTVYYTNLMPGRSYTVSGTLVDKSTGKNLMIGGSEVTAEKTFTPEEKDGIVELSFEFDCSSLTGKSVVAYEFLYRDGIMIAGHADINDEAQTVTIGKKPTPTPVPPTKVPGRPSTPSTPGTTTRSAPVRTGDTTNIILPVILLGVSAAVIAAFLIRRKKKA